MSSTGGGLPPAGWYPDPRNPAVQRFWDGAQWTEHRAPLPAAEEESPPPPPTQQLPALTQPLTQPLPPVPSPVPPPTRPLPPVSPPGGGSSARLPWVLAAVGLAAVIALAAVVVVLLLRGDAEPVAGASASPTSSVEASPSATGPSETPSQTEGESEKPSDTAEPTDTGTTSTFAFDEPIEYDGGMTVTLANPRLFTPSSTAAGYEAGQTAFRFDVVVENWSDEAYVANDMTLLAGAGADDTACSFIADVEQDLAGAPEEIVGSMDSTTFGWGFACDAGPGESVYVMVSPGVSQDFAPSYVEGTLPQ